MRLKLCNQRTTHANIDHLRVDLFGKTAIAWANGKTFFMPIKSPTVRKRRPRTHYINMSQYELATQGY